MQDQIIAEPGLSSLPRQLFTIRLVYFMAGIGISAWAIAVPFAKIRFHLNDGTLGLILMASGTGGVIAMPFTGPLIARFGSRGVRVLVLANLLVGSPATDLLPGHAAEATKTTTADATTGAATAHASALHGLMASNSLLGDDDQNRHNQPLI